MIPAIMKGHAVQDLIDPDSGVKISVMHGNGLVFSCWQPAPEELEQLVKGKPVWLIQRGPYIPGMTMQVGDEAVVVPSDVIRANLSGIVDQKVQDEAIRLHRQNMLIGKIVLWSGILAGAVTIGYALWRISH